MERYKEYKDSQIQWIGEIPSHWGIAKLNHVFTHNTGKTLNAKLKGNDLPYITTSNVYDGYFDLSSIKEMPFMENEIERYTVQYGDLLVCEGGDVGRCNIWKENYTICYQNHLHRLRPKMNVSVDYYFFLINLIKKMGVFENFSKGIAIKGLSSGTLGNTKLILPPLSEQERIVSFLEEKTAKIDTYVREKEKELQLLNELKESEIANVITHGLNPNVKMKDSGIPWIGMIPEHWETTKINSVFKERREKVSDKIYPPLSVSKQGITPQLESAVKTDNGDNRKKVNEGDFVVNSRSDRKGSCGISPYTGSVSLINIVLQPRSDIEGKYFHFLFRSNNYIEEYYRIGRGIVADLWTTRYSEMRNIIVPIPPIGEQRAIVNYIDTKCSKVDSLITELEAEIEHLREYKQRLIADCVTGQIKV